jgi:hypothetical protein
MAFTPISSQGTKLYLQTAAATYALIDGITSGDGSGGEREVFPATALSDQNPRSLTGFPSSQVLEYEVNVDPTDVTHGLLVTAKQNGTRKTFKLIFSDAAATTKYFDAYVSSFGMPSFQSNAPVKTRLRLAMDGDFRSTEA